MPRGHRRTRTETIFNGIVPPPPIDTTGPEGTRRGTHRAYSELSPVSNSSDEEHPAKIARKIPNTRAAEEPSAQDLEEGLENSATDMMSALRAGSSVTFAPDLVSPIPSLPKLPRSESMQSSSSTGSVTGPFDTASSINRPGTPFPTNEATPGYSPPPSEFTEESASIAIEVDEASTLGDLAG